MSEKEWKEAIEECRSSGMNIKAWCHQKGIKYSSYIYWVKKLSSQPQQWVQFQTASAANNEIKISCGNLIISVDKKTSLELLADVLKVVNDLCC